jgi:hypothetical protein
MGMTLYRRRGDHSFAAVKMDPHRVLMSALGPESSSPGSGSDSGSGSGSGSSSGSGSGSGSRDISFALELFFRIADQTGRRLLTKELPRVTRHLFKSDATPGTPLAASLSLSHAPQYVPQQSRVRARVATHHCRDRLRSASSTAAHIASACTQSPQRPPGSTACPYAPCDGSIRHHSAVTERRELWPESARPSLVRWRASGPLL